MTTDPPPIDHAGQGKIQRAPRAVRDELCRRMENGALGPQLLPWLNSLPEVREILANHFANEDISAKNLSDFRTGYYQKWLAQRRSLERQKAISQHALDIVAASGRKLGTAAAQLAAGRLVAAVDALGDEEAPPASVVKAIAMLRSGDIDEASLETRQRELDLREEDAAWKRAGKVFAALQNKALPDVTPGESPDDPEGQKKMRDIVRIIAGDDLLARMDARRKEAGET